MTLWFLKLSKILEPQSTSSCYSRIMLRLTVATSFKSYSPMLVETINSVVNQKSVLPDELDYVVWYGGPKDVRVDKQLAPFKDSLRVIYGDDSGLFDSLAQVFSVTSGEVVSYLNVGDLWSDKTARFVLDTFASNLDKSWICGLASVYGRNGMLISTRLPFRFRRNFIRAGVYGRLHFLPVIQQESTFWRRELLEHLDFEIFRNLKRAGDAYMWAKFAEHEELHVFKVALGGYREHDNHLAGGYHQYQSERTFFQEEFKLRWFPLLLLDKVAWRALDSSKISLAKGFISEV
jgi:hypothetical protein